MSLGLYLHIPYCLARCRYCDFYSRGGQKEVPDAYVDALAREMARWGNCDCTALRPDTLYFGGGTPSRRQRRRSPWRPIRRRWTRPGWRGSAGRGSTG